MAGGVFGLDAAAGPRTWWSSELIGANGDGTAVLDGTSDSSIDFNSNARAVRTSQQPDRSRRADQCDHGGRRERNRREPDRALRRRGLRRSVWPQRLGLQPPDPGELDRERHRRDLRRRPTGAAIKENCSASSAPCRLGDSHRQAAAPRRATRLEQRPDLANNSATSVTTRSRSSAMARTRTRSSPTSAAQPTALRRPRRDDGPGNRAMAQTWASPRLKSSGSPRRRSPAPPARATGPGLPLRLPQGRLPGRAQEADRHQDVKPDGTWKLKPGGKIEKSWVIIAIQTDEIGNGSELSKGKQRR